MICRSIESPERFVIVDDNVKSTCYGCDQAWYTTEWQRRAGCGPSVACNIFQYVVRSGDTIHNKQRWLSLMEEAWEYVTPTPKGMPTLKLFYESVLSYARAKGKNIKYECCDVPEDKSRQPTLHEMVSFIEKGLLQDAPVAFLNLCNGSESNLYRWHWVTIISLEYAEDESMAYVTILDEGLIKKIDLVLWHGTTTLGGGFVYIVLDAD